MAFDQSTRNRLSRFVTDTRKLLSDELAQQLREVYGLDPVTGIVTDLDKLPTLTDSDRQTASMLRDTLEHYLASTTKRDKKLVAATLDRIVREQAFTVLNRLCAIRMAEARDLVVESIAKGTKSKGFQLYARLAGTALGETGEAYVSYLFSLFDELSMDLPVLFDRYSINGRLFPRESVLIDVLAQLNHHDLDHLWSEDETIGWIYQYFNSQEERKAMRDASSAPRDSRELAVRNQFFTPRYVVEFLTDNTLGRIWYEMTQGKTGLKESCRYLVRRPTEIFLVEGQTTPDPSSSLAPYSGRGVGSEGPEVSLETADLTQEELLKQPVFIPFRPLKDPRDLKMLDPACGSMHFGLYAFDLFLRIYEEAWDLEEKLGEQTFVRSAGLNSLRDSYGSRDRYLLDVPRLIIERNIHGIDIDARAVQIAGLSLWLRAQRTWHEGGIKPLNRPRITKSNIVCAEPMPGESELLEQFVTEHLSETSEQQTIASIVRRVFDAMKLAGEAGSLLKIQEEIASTIAEAKKKWVEGPKSIQLTLFAIDEKQKDTGARPLLVAGIDDSSFWDEIEERIYDALKEYGEQAGGGMQRRLFADDAAQGFAFVDLCRKRYDVVVMNPPFGNPPACVASTLSVDAASNIYPAFVLRGAELCDGFIGAITDRTFVVQQSFGKFRNRLISDLGLIALAELGWGVLDGADVQVATYIVRKGNEHTHLFVSIRADIGDPAQQLLNIIAETRWTALSKRLIRKLPSSAFAHTLPVAYLAQLESQGALSDLAELPRGLGSNDSNRTYKAWYEVPVGSIGEGNHIEACATAALLRHFTETIRALPNGFDAMGNSSSKWGILKRTRHTTKTSIRCISRRVYRFPSKLRLSTCLGLQKTQFPRAKAKELFRIARPTGCHYSLT